MDEQRRDADPDEDIDRAVAGREGQGHELALVAQLGDEDDGEAEEEGVELGRHLGQSILEQLVIESVWLLGGVS